MTQRKREGGIPFCQELWIGDMDTEVKESRRRKKMERLV